MLDQSSLFPGINLLNLFKKPFSSELLLSTFSEDKEPFASSIARLDVRFKSSLISPSSGFCFDKGYGLKFFIIC